MDNPTPADRKALEELWRQRLNDAKLRVDFAREYLKEVVRDFPPNTLYDSDGHFAHHQAGRSENAAVREYTRILRIFHDLTVNGVVPDETAWLKQRAARVGQLE